MNVSWDPPNNPIEEGTIADFTSWMRKWRLGEVTQPPGVIGRELVSALRARTCNHYPNLPLQKKHKGAELCLGEGRCVTPVRAGGVGT